MQRTVTPSSVWQRRTHRLVAATIIFIGLTMMISNITQCIYMGMVFIMVALMWLAWMTMKERKIEPPRPHAHQSPVLFLVTSHMLPGISRSNVANALDKPPSYDTIVSLDGLPPDYSSVQLEKPPRYEEVAALYKAARDSDIVPHETLAGPSGVVMLDKADQPGEETSNCSEVFNERITVADGALETALTAESDGAQAVAPSDEDLHEVATRTSLKNSNNRDRKCGKIQREGSEGNSMDVHVQNAALDDTEQSGTRMSRLQPKRSSLSQSFRMKQDLRKQSRERKRNASASDCRNSEATTDGNLSPTKSLLRLQVPTLSQDTAGSAARYLDSPDTTNSTFPSVHSQSFRSRKSRTLPSTSAGCVAPTSMSDFDASSVDRAEVQDRRDDVTGPTTEYNSSDGRQLTTVRA